MQMLIIPLIVFTRLQARNQLRTPGGAESFLRGAQVFTLFSIDLKYVLNIFPEGKKKFLLPWLRAC